VLDLKKLWRSSKVSVDNFVDRLPRQASGPYKSRLCLNCPQKKQFKRSYMNQALRGAMALIAGDRPVVASCGTAAQIL
jgi:hypothetical protein